MWRMMDAVRTALEDELERDPDVFVAGIDVGEGGNVFALTRGLAERWPDRVRDTPISETRHRRARRRRGDGRACGRSSRSCTSTSSASASTSCSTRRPSCGS